MRTNSTFWQWWLLMVRREKGELTSECTTTRVDSCWGRLTWVNHGMRWVGHITVANVELKSVCIWIHFVSYIVSDVSTWAVHWQRHSCSYWTKEHHLLLPSLQAHGCRKRKGASVNEALFKIMHISTCVFVQLFHKTCNLFNCGSLCLPFLCFVKFVQSSWKNAFSNSLILQVYMIVARTA